jgi:mRNA interferase MazF
MTFSQWSVWLANLDPVVGSEQGKTRPVLILSQTSLNRLVPVVNVIPLTSRKSNRRIYPNEALLPYASCGLTVDSIALCYQIRTLEQATANTRLWSGSRSKRARRDYEGHTLPTKYLAFTDTL